MSSLSWNYSFMFGGFTDSFTIITDATPDSSGDYAALGIYGIFGGQAITGLDTNFFLADNLLSLGSAFVDGVDGHGVSFDATGDSRVSISNFNGAFDVNVRPGGTALLSPGLIIAPTFTWNYVFTLNGFTDNVTVVTGTTPNSAGAYAATGVFGTFGGQPITGINTTEGAPDNLLSNASGFVDGVDYSGVSFNAGGAPINLFDNFGVYSVVTPTTSSTAVTPTFTDNATTSWTYNFTLGGFTDNFTVVTASNSGGNSAAKLVYGTFGGHAITGLDGSYLLPDNLLGFNSGYFNGVDHNGISFDVITGGRINLYASTTSANSVSVGTSNTAVTPTLTTAGVFTWSYSFTLNGFTDSFTVVTGTTPTSNGGFAAMGISGTYHGQAITGLSTALSGDNTLGVGQSYLDGVDDIGLDFSIAAGTVEVAEAYHNPIVTAFDPFLDFPTTVTPVFSTDAACYRAGTRILTDCGEVAVERLRVGDKVVTESGRARPVRWLGHRTVRCASHPSPESVYPVRIAANAFGLGLPQRDLWLSPDHSVFADGCLIQVSLLVNGRNVVRDPVERVQYWHVELDTHDVILAEGMPAETYLDTGNRGQFANAPIADLQPEFRRVEAEVAASLACAPIVTGGAVLEAVRSWLAETAEIARAA